jgi:hypothetical protein
MSLPHAWEANEPPPIGIIETTRFAGMIREERECASQPETSNPTERCPLLALILRSRRRTSPAAIGVHLPRVRRRRTGRS